MSLICAVLDVGKSNTKTGIVSVSGEILSSEVMATPHIKTDAPYPAFDVDHIFDWFLERLESFARRYPIDRVIPVAHGAAAALLDGNDQLVFPIQDYEAAIPQQYTEAYNQIRPAFEETLSPNLPAGLNLGRQIYWQAERDPTRFQQVDSILPYPQYWAWRLSGQATCEVTSLGCHTDMWSPTSEAPSSLCTQLDWGRRFPRRVSAWDAIGTIKPEIAQATGLPSDCQVHAGVHDTNSALFSVIAGNQHTQSSADVSVLSTGTWFIAMAPGAPTDDLSEGRDCLANVDVFGRSVPCARFMGGRAYEIISAEVETLPFDTDSIYRLIDSGALPIPSFVDAGGPFQGRPGTIIDLKPEDEPLRPILGALYQALVSDVCLDLVNAADKIIVEGPAAKNKTFCSALAALRGAAVYTQQEARGVMLGAAALSFWPEIKPQAPALKPVAPLNPERLQDYRQKWRRALG